MKPGDLVLPSRDLILLVSDVEEFDSTKPILLYLGKNDFGYHLFYFPNGKVSSLVVNDCSLSYAVISAYDDAQG